MSIFPDKTLQDVLAAIDPVKLLQLINYRVDTLQDSEDAVKCFCPIHKEAVFRTLIVSKVAKDYRCSYSLCPGNHGGSLIDLYARVREIPPDEAVQRLVDELRLVVELPPAREIIDRTLEEGENFLYLLKTDQSRPEMYLEEALNRLQRVLEVAPDNPKALKGLYEVMEFKKETESLPALSRRRIEVESQAGHHDEVVSICRTYLAQDPNNREVREKLIETLHTLDRDPEAVSELMALADCCESQQDYDGAIEAYRRVARLDVVDIDVHPMIVNLLQASGHPKEAVEECLSKAGWLADRTQFAEAIEILRSALDVDPTRDDVRARLVEYSLLLGLDSRRINEALALVDDMIGRNSLQAAAQILHTLCQADPANTHVLDKLVEVKKRQGDTTEVLSLQYRLADLYRDQEDCASALLLLEEISSSTSGAIEALQRIAHIHRLEGDHSEAVRVYYEIVQRARGQDRLDDAIAAGEKIIEIQPDDVDHRELVIQLYIQAGRHDLALARILGLMEALEMRGDVDRLVAQLRSALHLAPARVDLRIRLARSLESQGDTEEALNEHMRAAEQLLRDSRFAEAIEQLDLVLAKRADDLTALSLLAEALVHTGKSQDSNALLLRLASLHIAAEHYESARDTLERLLRQAPDHVQGLQQLADVYTGLGDEDMVVATLERLVAVHLNQEQWDEARSHCRAILDLRPDHIEAHRSLVRIHERLDQRAEALGILLELADIFRARHQPRDEQDTLESVLQREAANRVALRRLAELSLETADTEHSVDRIDRYLAVARETSALDEAIDFLRTLLTRESENVEYHIRLVNFLQQANRTREVVSQLQTLIDLHQRRQHLDPVVELYRRILDIEPDNVTQRANLITVLLQLKRPAEAVEEYLRLADEHERQNRYDDAEQIVQEILKIDPRNEAACRRLVALSRARGNSEKAIEWLHKLADLQEQDGQTDCAIATFQEVLRFDPLRIDARRRIVSLQVRVGQTDLAVSEYTTIVDLYRQAGDLGKGVESQREAVALLPEDPDLRRGLINLLIEQGDIASAIEELFALADLLRRREAYEEVLNALAELLEFDPNNLRARKLRGEIYAQTGRDKEALQELFALTEKLENPEVLRGLGYPQAVELPEELPLVDEYTFDTFVVGDRNNFAYATALATAKAPAKHYNPLFLYSDVGLGKTHLLHAIGNHILANSPKCRILYTTSEEFTSHLIEAIQTNTITQFRQAHREIDVLLIDDVQFLAGKERAQEEFFHIFNTLFQAKKQIVVTSDRPPKDIAHLEKRLKSRFGAGVVVDMHPPDFETRTAIIKREVQSWPDLGFTPEIISLIAQKIESNVRELKGAIRQVVAAHDLQGESLTPDMVSRVLDQLLTRV